jgi:hypothetical protein
MEIEARYEGFIDIDKPAQFSYIVNKYGHRNFIPYHGNVDNFVIGMTYLLTI